MYIIREIKLKDSTYNSLQEKVDSLTRTKKSKFEIFQSSIDARCGIKYVYSVLIDGDIPKHLLKNKSVQIFEKKEYEFKPTNTKKSVVIIGFGPSGIFAAYYLSKSGVKVTVIERGEKIEDRTQSVRKFFEKGSLNFNSNISFGEGGAGTFSDGKLTSRSKDPRLYEVLKTLTEFGAPSEILHKKMPHVGTDILREIIIKMRKHLEDLGTKFYFSTKADDFVFKDGKLIKVFAGEKEFEADDFVLAIGNSSWDTIENLKGKIKISNKNFAVGFRIEHLREDIDKAQYKENYKNLPSASYNLSYKAEGNKGVYTFCMCPGGYVINSSSYEGCLSVNGMSYHKRDFVNSNSAIVTSVNEEDYGDCELSALNYQKEIERKAFYLEEGIILLLARD